jgi:O-antigen ligase
MQYKTKGEIKGSSMIQRLEMIKISIIIIKNNFMFGTGTGDVPDAFKNQLEISKSPLSDTRIRSHNQYLSLFVAFGIIGFLLSLLSLIYPYFISDAFKNYFVVVFMLIFLMSIFTEDTIESLSGATFYSFFGSLYLFQRPKTV